MAVKLNSLTNLFGNLVMTAVLQPIAAIIIIKKKNSTISSWVE